MNRGLQLLYYAIGGLLLSAKLYILLLTDAAPGVKLLISLNLLVDIFMLWGLPKIWELFDL